MAEQPKLPLDHPLLSVALKDARGLHAFLRTRVGSTDASDVLQVVYERLLKVPTHELAQIGSTKAYVYRIVMNAAHDHLRESRRARPLHPDDQPHGALGSDDDPERHAFERQARHAVETQISALPAGQREVIVLRYLEGMSRAEIASALDLTEEVVSARLARAIASVTKGMQRTVFGARVDSGPKDGLGQFASKLYEVKSELILPANEIITDIAPKIEVASATLAERLKKTPEEMHRLAPREFEYLVAELLSDLGYRVEVTPATRDGGKDLLAYLDTALGTLLCLVEVKKYRRDRKIGIDLVRSLYGTLCDAQANSAILVTTSSFSKDAREFQRKHEYQLSLRDYDDVVGWLRTFK